MRPTAARVRAAVAGICVRANTVLRPDVLAALRAARRREAGGWPRRLLDQLLENARLAKKNGLAVCQDTGLPVVFVGIGRDVDLRGLDLERAVRQGVAEGYRRGSLRNSIVPDPLDRGTPGFSPCIIHYEMTPVRGLSFTVLPKGFGCENKTQLKMFNPTAGMKAVEDFIVACVRQAGPDACPPYIVGVGIGGASDTACLLSKKALLRPVGGRQKTGRLEAVARRLVKRLNTTGIGPLGLGGKATVLGVSILTHPTHIAGLPVCVNISCHALRSAHVRLR
ncbi:MAG: fumarate hydratase [Deltaproteobacteria bacterium]